MQTRKKQTCQICEKETEDIKEVWGHKICSCCIMLAVDCLKKEIEDFEKLLDNERQRLN